MRLEPGVLAALSSVRTFLREVGLPATAHALDSEVEKKAGKVVPRSMTSLPLDRLLSALVRVDDENVNANSGRQVAHAELDRKRCGRIPRTLTAQLRGAEESGARGKDMHEIQVATDSFRFERSAPVALLRGHREALVNLEILPGSGEGREAGPLIFSASLDNTLRLWSVSGGAGECQAVLRAPGGQLSDARVLSEGKYAACCNETGKTYLMDMMHSRCLEEFSLGAHQGPSGLGFRV